MNYLLTFFLLFLLCMVYATYKDAQFIISPIKGFMFGALYNRDELNDSFEHTVQFCFVFVNFTTIWETPK